MQLEPNDFDECHSASRALTTNQPASAGASPEPESSSRASGTRRSLTVHDRHILMAVMARDAAVDFLLASNEPAIRFLTRRDILGEDVQPDPDEIRSGPLVRGLMGGQKSDGGFGVFVYHKWTGAHWRLVSLVELGVPADDRLHAAAGTVLDWLT